MTRKTLTHPTGPVVASERTIQALAAIRKLKFLPMLYEHIVIGKQNLLACEAALSSSIAPEQRTDFTALTIDADRGYSPVPGLPWLLVVNDRPDQQLPARVQPPNNSTASEAATLRLGVGIPASLVLIEGAAKERAKLSFIKCEGTISLLVTAFRQGHLSAVQPMVKALAALGFNDVIPPQDLLDALWKALDGLDDA